MSALWTAADLALASGGRLVAQFEANGISIDTRGIRAGDLFVALEGENRDGHLFVADALAKGAAVVVGERAPPALSAPFVQVEDARAALAKAAARFYPRQPDTVVAVTGTSGKTSVAAFARQIWAAAGRESASLGTLGVVSRPIEVYGSLTTPDPVALHQTLDRLAGAGVTHVALEASSHGLDQKRLDGVRISAGAFTNLSRDHLDYHATTESYLDAKLRLFRELLPPGAAAVIDGDSDVAPRVVEAARAHGLSLVIIGRRGGALRLVSSQRDGFASRIVVEHAGKARSLRLPLPGDFQVSNALVAAGLCFATGTDLSLILAALERLEGAPGRLERVGDKDGAPVFVDYAHKPDALDKALAALRPFVAKRLLVVFGCGGDRDAGKRPMMGAIASKRADLVFVTDDNPRSEDPAAIRAAILAAAPGAREFADRGEAIRAAIDALGHGDALLIAGKGHETGQIVGDRTMPFSDAEAARAALEEAA